MVTLAQVVACGGSAVERRVITLADGRQATELECWRRKDECLETARRICRGGYHLVSENKKKVVIGAQAGGSRWRFRMVIACAGQR